MSKYQHVIIAVVATLLVCGGIFYAWVKAHDAKIQMQQTIRDKDFAIAQRDKQLADQTAQFNDLKKQTKTPRQVVANLPKVVDLPKPIVLVRDLPQSQSSQISGLIPQADGGALIPAESLKPLFDHLAQCRIDSLALTACRQDKADVTDKFNAAVRAARGGGFWSRLRANKNAALVGAGVGAVLTYKFTH